MTTYYGFLLDPVFYVDAAIDMDNVTDDRLIGYLDDKQFNYFQNPLRITDKRIARSAIHSEVLIGTMRLVIDKVKLLDGFKFEGVTSEELEQFFNIIEYMSQTQGANASDMNAHMMGDSNYGVYVTDSADLAATYTTMDLPLPSGSIEEIDVRDWIRFSVELNSVEYTFKIWLSNEQFTADYPYSIIRKVVFPCETSVLLSPTTVGDINAIIAAQSSDNEALAEAIGLDDYSDMEVYYTKFINTVNSMSYQIPFSVLYQGVKPSSLEIREAIRAELIATGAATEDVWKAILPNLFVTDQFFMVPIWNNTVVLPDNTINSGVIDPTTIIPKAQEVWPDMDLAHIEDSISVLMDATFGFYIFSVPDPLNESNDSLMDVHPTYRPYNATQPAFAQQTAVTQMFNRMLVACLAVLQGEINNGDYIENEFYNRRYLSFVVDSIEYHILYPADYVLED